MLVLRRKVDEEIEVVLPGGERIRVMVCSIQKNGKTAQIGIQAPMGCQIRRIENDNRVT